MVFLPVFMPPFYQTAPAPRGGCAIMAAMERIGQPVGGDSLAIIANGAPPEHAGERAALAACAACVCCDRLPPPGAPPLLQVVGDCDTLRPPLPPDHLLTRDADQETNDLTKAMRWCRAQAPGRPLAFFAVAGGRLDHTLANLSLIAEGPAPARVYANDGAFALLPAGRHVLGVESGAPLSLLSFAPQRVTARGVAWPVEDLPLRALWRATLNRATGPVLEVDCQAPLFVYQPWSVP